MILGCGGSDLTFPGEIVATPVPAATETPTCAASGDVCNFDSDCCSGSCISPDGVSFQCQ